MAVKGTVRIDVFGDKEARQNLKTCRDQMLQAAGAGLYMTASVVMTGSLKRVPVDFGILKGSGFVTLPEIGPQKVEVEIGYGGPAKDYAEVQHERTDFHHEVGEAKYLQRAVDAEAGTMEQTAARYTREAFDRKQGAAKVPGMPSDPNSGEGA